MVQSAYFGRREKGLRRSIQWVLELEIEVRLLGFVIDRLEVRLAVWGTGDVNALGEKIADSKRIIR